MKILILQPWISYRGAESVSLEEALGLNALGSEAWVMCLFVDRERLPSKYTKVHFITPSTYLSKLFASSKFALVTLGFAWLVYTSIRQAGYFDALNPHNFPCLWVAVIAGRITKTKVLWTIHNFPQVAFKSNYLAAIWNKTITPVDKAFASRADVLVCVSPKVAHQAGAIYRHPNIKVVLPPVDFTFFGKLRAGRVKRNLILIVSRLHHYKDPQKVLDIINMYVSQGGKFDFVIAGDGPMLGLVKHKARSLGLSNRLKILGFVSKDNLVDLYAQARLVLLPAFRGEGFNIVVLEALCQATPSMVMRGCGIDKWLKTNKVGFVSAPKVDHVVSLLLSATRNQRYLNQTGLRGRTLVRNTLTPQLYARKLVALI